MTPDEFWREFGVRYAERECVGGPRDGQTITVPRGAPSVRFAGGTGEYRLVGEALEWRADDPETVPTTSEGDE